MQARAQHADAIASATLDAEKEMAVVKAAYLVDRAAAESDGAALRASIVEKANESKEKARSLALSCSSPSPASLTSCS